MSDLPRDQHDDGRPGRSGPDPADEPTTGAPAGAVSATVPPAGPDHTGATPPYAPGRADSGAARDSSPEGPHRTTRSTGTYEAKPGQTGGRKPAGDPRRRRRLIVAAVSVAAPVLVIAICAGGLAVLRAFGGLRDDAADARQGRRLSDDACLELEDRLNRLIPPGATTTPQARAAAVSDENAAIRIYLGRLNDQRVSDGWRELLDARTAFAEALGAQAKARVPAFFVAPAPRDGVTLADRLARWSPAGCAGPIRRLTTPDL